ncbi:hypothetical protein [Paracoccus sp. Ld10]|uniref:hypothetical protein n=1 Tax=Paracoccus sp. Ld10 TaxID=649158 RepID=UPI0038695FA5
MTHLRALARDRIDAAIMSFADGAPFVYPSVAQGFPFAVSLADYPGPLRGAVEIALRHGIC